MGFFGSLSRSAKKTDQALQVGYFKSEKKPPDKVRGPRSRDLLVTLFKTFVDTGKAIPIVSDEYPQGGAIISISDEGKAKVVDWDPAKHGDFAMKSQPDMYTRTYQSKPMFTNANLISASKHLSPIYKSKNETKQILNTVSSSTVAFSPEVKVGKENINIRQNLYMATFSGPNAFYIPDKKKSTREGDIELVSIKVPGTTGTIRVSMLTKKGVQEARNGRYAKLYVKRISNALNEHPYAKLKTANQVTPTFMGTAFGQFYTLPYQAQEDIIKQAVEANVLGKLSAKYKADLNKFKNEIESGTEQGAIEAATEVAKTANAAATQVAKSGASPEAVETAESMVEGAEAAKNVISSQPNERVNAVKPKQNGTNENANMKKLFKELTNADFTLAEIRNLIEKKKFNSFVYREQEMTTPQRLENLNAIIKNMQKYNETKATAAFKNVKNVDNLKKAYKTFYNSVNQKTKSNLNKS